MTVPNFFPGKDRRNNEDEKTLLALLMMGLIWPILAVADQYRLITGKKVPVCELCKKNLESLQKPSIACEREYNPKFAALKPVEWTKLDVMAHKDLVRKIERFAAYGDQEATGKTVSGSTDIEFEETLRDEVRRKTLGLSTVVTDIDNDGQPEVVLRCEGGSCPLTRGHAHQLNVITPDHSALDVEKTNRLSEWARGSSVGIFFYENTTYVDIWDDLEDRLVVYKYVNGKAEEVCGLKYRQPPKTSRLGR